LEALAAPKEAATGPAAVRAAVREYMLGAVRGLERLRLALPSWTPTGSPKK